jgi:hypothetical protein
MCDSTRPSEPFKLISGLESISFSQTCGGEKVQAERHKTMLKLSSKEREILFIMISVKDLNPLTLQFNFNGHW